MQLVYIGPHDSVMVPLPYGGQVEVKRGKEATLPDSLSESLLKQTTNWERSKGGDK